MKIYLLLKFGLCGPEAPISGFVKVKVAYGAPKACLTTDLSNNQYRIFFHPILGEYEWVQMPVGLLFEFVGTLFLETFVSLKAGYLMCECFEWLVVSYERIIWNGKLMKWNCRSI